MEGLPVQDTQSWIKQQHHPYRDYCRNRRAVPSGPTLRCLVHSYEGNQDSCARSTERRSLPSWHFGNNAIYWTGLLDCLRRTTSPHLSRPYLLPDCRQHVEVDDASSPRDADQQISHLARGPVLSLIAASSLSIHCSAVRMSVQSLGVRRPHFSSTDSSIHRPDQMSRQLRQRRPPPATSFGRNPPVHQQYHVSCISTKPIKPQSQAEARQAETMVVTRRQSR